MSVDDFLANPHTEPHVVLLAGTFSSISIHHVRTVPPATPSHPRPSSQRMRWEEREELLSGEVTALQRRCAVAEARSADVEASLPSATRPLLHQLEAMQAAAVSQAEAWAAAEREAVARLEAALQAGRRAEEGRAAACAAADAAAREAGDLRAALEEVRGKGSGWGPLVGGGCIAGADVTGLR